MQAVQLLIKTEILKDTKKESKIFVCFLSLRLAIIYGNEEVTIVTTMKQFSLSLLAS